jgi:hypothetical protein
VIVSVLIGAIVVIGLYVASHKINGLQLTLVLALAALGTLLVVFPDLASRAAAALGVGRGTDLLLYFAIVGGMFVAAHFYFRFKRQEQQVVAVVRALAILETEKRWPSV